MTTKACNSLNIGQQGVVYFDGVSQFSGSDGGTAGQVYTSNGTGVSPSFQPAGGSFLQVIKGPSIDVTTIGAKTIFTPSADFIVIGINCYAETITGSATAPIVNFGWTPPTYSDLVNGYNAFPTTQGEYLPNIGAFINIAPVLPASTPLVMFITTADITASVDIQRVDVFGYYL